MKQAPSTLVFRLTALWALCESGLGGWMHALHLPFTGFFVGALAVIIISLLAFYSGGNARTIVQATLIVIAVKAAVSPQSPPPAYIAVAFQGFLGALLFSALPFRPACLLLGLVAMVESALQKILVATLIFGKSLWQAIDALFKAVVKDLSLPPDVSFSFWIIAAYTGIYALWGLVLGFWMMRLPQLIAAKATEIKAGIALLPPDVSEAMTPRRRKSKLPAMLAVLVFVSAVFLFSEGLLGRAGFVVLRTFAVLALLVCVVNPLFRWLMKRFLQRQSGEKQFISVIEYLPELRAFLRPAWQLARQQRGVFARFRWFVLALLILTIYDQHETT